MRIVLNSSSSSSGVEIRGIPCRGFFFACICMHVFQIGLIFVTLANIHEVWLRILSYELIVANLLMFFQFIKLMSNVNILEVAKIY